MSTEVMLGGNNSRERKLKQFLAKPPKRAIKLVQYVAADEHTQALQLGEWEVSEVAPVLCAEILDRLESHAIEVGGVVVVHLTWIDKEGGACGSHVLKRQANHVESGEDTLRAATAGDSRSVIVAATAQSLATQRLYLQGIEGVMAKYERIAERDDEAVRKYLRRIAELEMQNEQLREALMAAEEICVSPQKPATDAQERVLKMCEALAPMLVQRLLASSAAAPQAST